MKLPIARYCHFSVAILYFALCISTMVHSCYVYHDQFKPYAALEGYPFFQNTVFFVVFFAAASAVIPIAWMLYKLDSLKGMDLLVFYIYMMTASATCIKAIYFVWSVFYETGTSGYG